MEHRVGDVLTDATLRLREAGVETPQLDSQLLMAHVLNCSRLDLIAHPERVLTDSELIDFRTMLDKRSSRFPLAYILGCKEFYGLELQISSGVLVPRPETELLVEECIKRLRRDDALIADIGAGSGTIAVALGISLPASKIYSTEISTVALEVAQANVEKHQLAERVSIIRGDLLVPLIDLDLKFDAIVSNPPYISTAEIETLEPEVRLYEPREALDGGEDGLDVYRRLFPESLDLLREDGFVGVEIGAGQANSVRNIAELAGYGRIEVIRDLAGIERIVIAYR